ncbi:aminotransferase class IV [Thalassospiraceae bacterium LMO-JJ14]|nr:aminotransferase class IV [Thalassospiraceae bacterium LMO-JJ14]
MNIWLNGNIVDAGGAIDARERGVLLGDGVFETLALIDAAPLRLQRHIQRIGAGAKVLGIPMMENAAAIADAMSALCDIENVIEGSARITLLRGPAPRGVLPPENPSPTLMISVAPGTVGGQVPLSVIIAKSTRRNEYSPLASIKSTNYLDAIIAAREARATGADDALLLNTRGQVCEATAANLFCRYGDTLVTPPVSDGVLPGIMRACVMDRETVTERSLAAEEVCRADEIFLTSSLAIRPVIAVDGEPVGGGKPGPVAARLCDLPRHAV